MPKNLNHVDLDQNQLLNVVLHSLATAPGSPVDGQLYYNTSTKIIYKYNATTTTWEPIGGGAGVIGGNGLGEATAGGVVTLSVNVDGATLEISADTVRIKDIGVTTAKLADNAVTTVKIVDKAITFAKIQDIPTMTVIGRLVAATGVPSGVIVINDNTMAGAAATNLATAGSIKAYIDSRVASIGVLIGGFDASVQTTFPTGTQYHKGDYWYVTAAGTVQGVSLAVGDMMIANKDNPSPTLASDWIFLESLNEQATTTIMGLVYLATTTEVQTGTDASKAVTPATLSARTATLTRTGLVELATDAEAIAGVDTVRAVTPSNLLAVLNGNTTGLRFSTAVGDGAALSYTITHNLNTKDLMIELFDGTTGETVYTNVTRPTVNTIQLSFAKAVALNKYRVFIMK